MTDSGRGAISAWRPLDPRAATELIDARLQTHHAAQLVAGLGVSYLSAHSDDSHTNLEWVESASALASRPVHTPSSALRLAVRPNVFALLLLDANNITLATFLLNGRTRNGALRWLRDQLSQHGLDPAKYSPPSHYTIPPHAVGDSTPFNATTPGRFEELANWFADGASALEKLAASMPAASEVRCWPHHFDLATLIEVAPATDNLSARTLGVGMEPGDGYYREPYFYVNMYPAPGIDTPRPALGGEGVWHTNEWLGAVLPASRVVAGSGGQRSQIEEFIASAVRVCMNLLMKH